MNKGTCPVCNGSKRVPAGDSPYKHMFAGYNAITDTLRCDNCGGQTMESNPTGLVPLRADGTPCKHEYVGVKTRNCYTEYTCKHCGDHYAIDSGD